MEPKFQTSFIPKKQVASVGGLTGNSMGSGPAQQKAKANLTSAYMAVAVILFVVSIGAVGGAYFWKSYLKTANETYKSDLAKMEEKFDIKLIEKLKAKNIQIDTGKRLVNNHVALSSVFEIIQKMTVSDVRFNSMDIKGTPENTSKYTMSLKGVGRNLATVAFQAQVFSDLASFGLDKLVKNPMISSPALEPSGAVSFGISADIERGIVSYKNLVSGNNTGN
jgi:hypothetical protein